MSQSESPRQRALTTLRFSRSMLDKMLADFPADNATFQLSPHDNHVMWTLGHLASTYNWLTGLIGGTPHKLPESFDKCFGQGVKPNPDIRFYPPLAEVRTHSDAAYNNFVRTLEALPEASLSEPCVGETFGFARDRLDTAEKATWHEGWHGGQISTLRRALGLKPIFG